MPRTRFSLIVAAALATATIGCSSGRDPLAPTPPASELRAAPTLVTVAGTALRLETYLWRDFQPISPPDGKPLIAVMRVRAADGGTVPGGLQVDAAWVVNGGAVWAAEVRDEHGSSNAQYYEVVGRDGPKWGPGITVDVIVRVRDAQAGASRLLRAADQPIRMTQ